MILNKMVFESLGKILIPSQIPNRPHWFNSHAQAPNAIVFENKVRIYFSCRSEIELDGNYRSYPTYIDIEDFDNLKNTSLSHEPLMELGQLGTFDEFGIYPFSVIRERDKFYAYYGGWTRPESVPFEVNIGLATSIDGSKFERLGAGPVLSALHDEPFVISSPKIRKFNGEFVLTYISGKEWIEHKNRSEIYYKIRIAFSKDGINWQRLGKDIIESKLGKTEAQASPDIFFDGHIFHMFFCYRANLGFREDPKLSYKIGYAFSSDLINWTRSDENFQLIASKCGFDSTNSSYPNVFQYKNNIYMAYLGNDMGSDGFGIAIHKQGLI